MGMLIHGFGWTADFLLIIMLLLFQYFLLYAILFETYPTQHETHPNSIQPPFLENDYAIYYKYAKKSKIKYKKMHSHRLINLPHHPIKQNPNKFPSNPQEQAPTQWEITIEWQSEEQVVQYIMEEYEPQQCFSVQESEHSLLSHQMLKISKYQSKKSLMTSLQHKTPNPTQTINNFADFLLPILSLTNSFEFNPKPIEPTTTKTIKIPPRRNNPKNTESSTNTLGSTTKRNSDESGGKGKKGEEKAYRFLRLIRRGHRCDQLLFEQCVTSVKQITGEGYVLLRGGRVMQGEFVQGTPVGRILIRFENGMVYVGPVYNYRPHGIGEMRMANGEKYLGEFCYGEPHGQGVHYTAEGKVKREGEWRRGKFVQ